MQEERPVHLGSKRWWPRSFVRQRPRALPLTRPQRLLLFAVIVVTLMIYSTIHDHDNHKISSNCNSSVVVSGKEIVAQRDTWTLIGENDTVDAGMHIRIDMTTGEKWVKQITNDNNNDHHRDESTAVVVTGEDEGISDHEEETEVYVDGENRAARMELPKQITYNDNTFENEQAQPEPKYDYDMMYRTLRKLPVEEQIRMQLPLEYVVADDFAQSNDTATTRQHRQQFETRLRYIWEQRQKELLELEIADFPQILKEYIADLQTYTAQLKQPPSNVDDDEDPMYKPSDHNNENGLQTRISHNHIISILQELEYQLQDIDLTRDFHTLQGWKLLVSLLWPLSNQTNSGLNNSSHITYTATSITMYQQHEVQMYTAWVIGTALKHIPEFHTFAIEPIPIILSSLKNATAAITTTTALDITVQQIQTSYEEYVRMMAVKRQSPPQRQITNETTTAGDINSILKLLQTKLLRFLYCLGSLLRGNYHAQYRLLESSINVSPPSSQQELDVMIPSINLLQEFMDRVLLPSLQQVYHFEVVRSFTTANNQSTSSNASSSDSTIVTTSPDLEQKHIDFLYKFVQRSLNVVLDCLNEIQSNVNDNDENLKWSLRHTNPAQYQHLQKIYQHWHAILCTTTSSAELTRMDTEDRILRYHHSENSRFTDFHSFLSAPISSMDHGNELVEIRSTIRSILGHCPSTIDRTS